MSDYEIKNRNTSLNLMSSRLGLFNAPALAAVAGDGVAEEAALHGLDHSETLLKYNGGIPQQDRMIKDKRRSLDRALKYSYQGAFIKKVDNNTAVPEGFKPVGASETTQIRALINPNKLKPDYDDKIISVPFEHGFKAGDIFEWCNTDTKWLITSQNKTELAYFRGDIRRCNYLIKWLADDGIHECYAATRGPVETKVNFIQKSGISIDVPNHSLHILMPKRKDVIEYFKRYSEFYLSSPSLFEEDPNNLGEAYPICWRVEATDWVSTPGVFEMTAVEYFSNSAEDDIEAGLVGALIPKQVVDTDTHCIKGPHFIKPLTTVEFKYVGMFKTGWQVLTDKVPVELEVDANDATICRVKWNNAQSGQFVLECSGKQYTVVVESLF